VQTVLFKEPARTAQ